MHCGAGEGIYVSEPGADGHQRQSLLCMRPCPGPVGTSPDGACGAHGPPAPAHAAAPPHAVLHQELPCPPKVRALQNSAPSLLQLQLCHGSDSTGDTTSRLHQPSLLIISRHVLSEAICPKYLCKGRSLHANHQSGLAAKVLFDLSSPICQRTYLLKSPAS